MVLSMLIISISMGAVAWIVIDRNDRSGEITGPVILAYAKKAEAVCQEAFSEQEREKAAALAEAQKEAEPEDTESEEMESQEPEVPKEPDTIPNAEDEEVDPDMAPKLRIVLDPGHGGPGLKDEQELGAIYRDTYEKYLTLEIAKAMKEELSQYGNVEIFMTRNTDRALTLKERAAYAESVGGDLLVSLHLNASLEHNFYGSEVFVSAFDHFYARGAGVGESILNQLTDYGFVSKGVKTRLGSKGADYYGIIRECKSLGIPALIVEHGYMDEDSDWARMNTTDALKALGRRDGAGLAAYYGLEKGKILSELPTIDETIPSSVVRPDTTPPEEVWYRKEQQGDGRWLITLHGVERESRVMYYDYSLDGGETYGSLKLWDKGDTIQFPMSLTGEEQLAFRVYNNYELRTEIGN
jgi:N-acetylmuramoyl-L-alanine amidase